MMTMHFNALRTSSAWPTVHIESCMLNGDYLVILLESNRMTESNDNKAHFLGSPLGFSEPLACLLLPVQFFHFPFNLLLLVFHESFHLFLPGIVQCVLVNFIFFVIRIECL
jgi:hypothetical protein